ncbi:MAG: HD domain-containing protein [Desulfobulbaceae bacterium]|nr:HD domain-containing protein [Desulfobulbaceae bacterium]
MNSSRSELQGGRLPLGTALTDKLRAFAAACCSEEGGCHGPDHAERVHATALVMGLELGANLEILSAAALLHDIGRAEESKSRGRLCHAALGAALAEPLLLELGFASQMVVAIRHCIATHRYRDDNRPESLEAQILFDADKLDSLGAIGIGRAFLFAGQVGARLHNDERALADSLAYSLEDTAYREFKIKLCRLPERMLTPIGRRLAGERQQFMQDFFTRLDAEIWGGIRDVQES